MTAPDIRGEFARVRSMSEPDRRAWLARVRELRETGCSLAEAVRAAALLSAVPAGKRWCFFIPVEQFDKHGWIPSVATEGDPFHVPLKGNGTAAEPWYWGKTYEAAKATCAAVNAERGITPGEAAEIVLSSFARGPRR